MIRVRQNQTETGRLAGRGGARRLARTTSGAGRDTAQMDGKAAELSRRGSTAIQEPVGLAEGMAAQKHKFIAPMQSVR